MGYKRGFPNIKMTKEVERAWSWGRRVQAGKNKIRKKTDLLGKFQNLELHSNP